MLQLCKFVALSVLLNTSLAKIMHGNLRTGENWHFLARFCFLSLHGKFEYELQYEEDLGAQNLDLYYDSPTQWARVYGRRSDLKTCAERESVLQVENNQFINLTLNMVVAGCFRHVDNNTGVAYIRCKGTRNFNTARERWWFIAVSNCNSSQGLKLSYNFLMSNGPENDILHHHYSADEFYLLPILFVASVLHFALLLIASWFAVALKSRQLLHSTYKLFLASVFAHTLGVTLLSAHFLAYGINGMGWATGKLYGRICEASADMIFVLLLILIAKGFTVTRARLRQVSTIKVSIFMCAYAITYTTLFIVERNFFDPGEVLYIYESLAGYGLVLLRTLGWFMFIYSTFFTLKHYPEKGGFYYPFFSFYTLWFVAGPCIIIIANHIIAQWVREKVVASVEHFTTFMGHFLFLFLTRPSAHNKNFPYHVRTTQIGIMEAMSANTTLGPNTLDNFGHGNNYSVTSHSTAMDIFSVEAASKPHLSVRKNGIPLRNISAEQNGHATNGTTKIYDPNEDSCSLDDDTMETTPTPNFISTSQENKNED